MSLLRSYILDQRDTVCVAGIHPSLEDYWIKIFISVINVVNVKTIYEFGHPFLFRDPDRKYVIMLSERKL